MAKEETVETPTKTKGKITLKKAVDKESITVKEDAKPAKKETVKKETKPRSTTAKTTKKAEKVAEEKVKLAENTTSVKIEKKKTAGEADSKSKIDKLGRAYATGKRKNAIAKVWISKGSGKITVNGKTAIEYLQRPILEVMVNVPFVVTDTQDKFDVMCQTLGGGLSGQAGAIKHAIAKALEVFNPIYRAELKAAGLLTRDSRIVERKKAGLKKARKGQVFQKR